MQYELFSVLLVALISVSSEAYTKERICGPNQIWTDCKSRCPLTCDNYKDPSSCTQTGCEGGCICVEGYVLRGAECVPKSSCTPPTKSCPANTTYVLSDARVTIKTCDKKELITGISGCYCKPGYVLNRPKHCCILPQDCPQVQIDKPQCGRNQVWTVCKSRCPLTCHNYRNPPICVNEPCEGGCVCAFGYVLQDNICVPMSSCKPPVKSCHFNTTYISVDDGITIKSCDNLDVVLRQSGCHCKPGYVFNKLTGRCCLPIDCPQDRKCRPNQILTKCKRRCPVTCENYQNPPFCPNEPCEEGCDCLPGHVLRGENCIPVSNCEPRIPFCIFNKTYVSKDIVVHTCDNILLTPKTPGCYCRNGYFYNRWTGLCVLRQDCPKETRCREHEKFSQCATSCPRTCKHFVPRQCSLQCRPGCVCEWPYVRCEITGKCVLPNKCPEPVCRRANEEFNECSTRCQPTCADPLPPCTKECHSDCYCKPGYIREYKNGRCIPAVQCPARRPAY